MTPEEIIIASVVHSWKQNVERADKVFSGLTDHQLQTEVAPGRNRLVYLWGHLTAVHDAMLPLLGLGDRLHPELAGAFLTAADEAGAAGAAGAAAGDAVSAGCGLLQATASMAAMMAIEVANIGFMGILWVDIEIRFRHRAGSRPP